MKSLLHAAVLSAAIAVGGCAGSRYDHLESWLIREDPVRAFMIPADVIYVQNDLYTSVSQLPIMLSYAQAEVGNGRFNGLARVFAPLVATPEDLELALKWYFRHNHESGRPFVFIGEGEGGRLLHDYETAREEDLKKDGMIASFYTDAARKGFVTRDTVRKIRNAVTREHFRRIWGRDMPEVEEPREDTDAW